MQTVNETISHAMFIVNRHLVYVFMIRKVIIKPKEFRDWCSNLKPIWSLDTETSSLNWLDLEIIGFSICDGTQACYVALPSSSAVDIKCKYKKDLLMILNFYLSEAKMVIMHSAPFDMMVLLKEGIEV